MSENCEVCLTFDREKLRQIEEIHNNSSHSVETISQTLGIPYDMLLKHVKNCLNTDNAPSEARLMRQVSQVEEDIRIARETYRDKSTASNSYALTGLLNEYKTIIAMLDERDNPEERVNKIVEQVINPMVRSLVGKFTEHAANARQAIEIAIDSADKSRADRALKHMLEESGADFQNLLRDAKEQLKRIHKIKK